MPHAGLEAVVSRPRRRHRIIIHFRDDGRDDFSVIADIYASLFEVPGLS